MGDLSKNFSRWEFRCGGRDGSKCADNCGFDTVDAELITVLQDVHDHFDRRVTVNCGCRCKNHNRKVGGAKKSDHLLARAGDIVVEMVPAHIIYDYLDEKYPDKYGIGKYDTFTHIGTRAKRARW